MLDNEMNVVQVQLNGLDMWPEAYQKAIGQMLIACSQWEHIYELLCKDLGITDATNLADHLAQADDEISGKKGIQSLKNALALNRHSDCKKIAELIDKLETKRELRHLVVHGFHHIYKEKFRVTRINKYGVREISRELSPLEVVNSAHEINEWINNLNQYRRSIFHRQPKGTDFDISSSSAISYQ